MDLPLRPFGCARVLDRERNGFAPGASSDMVELDHPDSWLRLLGFI